jgi:hypothetical protein
MIHPGKPQVLRLPLAQSSIVLWTSLATTARPPSRPAFGLEQERRKRLSEGARTDIATEVLPDHA